jgi:hypothetical protein
VGIEEGELVKAKGIENTYNKKIEKFPHLEKEMVIQMQEAFRTHNRQDQKKEPLQAIIIVKT